MKILLSIILVAGVAVAFLLSTTNANPVELGAEAPDVTATNQDGQTIKLGDAYKKGPVVVYFYPKAIPRAAPNKPAACAMPLRP